MTPDKYCIFGVAGRRPSLAVSSVEYIPMQTGQDTPVAVTSPRYLCNSGGPDSGGFGSGVLRVPRTSAILIIPTSGVLLYRKGRLELMDYDAGWWLRGKEREVSVVGAGWGMAVGRTPCKTGRGQRRCSRPRGSQVA